MNNIEMGNNYKTIVYLTTNIINKKIYIGVHNTDNPYVFDGYIGCGINIYYPSSNAHPSCPFHYAVKKYGFDAFVRNTIKVFDNRQDALNLERELVNEDFINRNDTYNITMGGGDPPRSDKEVFQYNLNGDFITSFPNVLIAEKSMGLKSGISAAIKYKSVSAGYLWAYEKYKKLDISNYKIVIQSKPIYAYDSDGNFVKKYSSLSQFCKENKITHGPVQRAIAGKFKAAGYYVSDVKIDKFIKIRHKKSESPIYQYDLEGNFIKEWPSCCQVYKELGYGYSQISSKIKRGNPICGDYQWSRSKLSKMNSVKKYSSEKQIGQYDIDGNLIKVFSTVRECRKEFGNVSRVLSGKAKQCKGYTFKYIVKDIV